MATGKLSKSLKTQRLNLLPVHENLAPKVAAFYRRNAAHLAPWDPPAPPGMTTETFQRGRLAGSPHVCASKLPFCRDTAVTTH